MKGLTKKELAIRMKLSYTWLSCALARPEFLPFIMHEGSPSVRRIKINDAFKQTLKEFIKIKLDGNRPDKRYGHLKELLQDNLSCLD